MEGGQENGQGEGREGREGSKERGRPTVFLLPQDGKFIGIGKLLHKLYLVVLEHSRHSIIQIVASSLS